MACCLDSEEEYLPVLGISHGEKTKILCKSVLTGDIGAVKALLDTGEYEQSLIFPDHHEGALHVAALHGHVDIVRMLIHHNANVNAANAFGQIPLHLACRKGYFDIVEMLLRAGSEVDYKDCGECTPLFHAVSASQTQVAQRLIDAGCDLDTLNEELITPLDQAVIFNQPEMVATLIKGGCQWEKLVGVVYPDHYTSSIFFSLWHNQDYDNIGLLLDCGFKLDHPMDPVILNTLLAICLPSEQPPFQHLSAAFKNPQSLKGCCRISIRRQLIINRYHMGKSLRSLINRLPLPRMLKSYLNFDSYPSITSMYENR